MRGLFQRGADPEFAEDFAHHKERVARLNHGSFGSAPRPVLEAASAARAKWLAQPDELYFTGELAASVEASERAAAAALGVASVSLVENSTVATAIVARRWAESRGKVLALSVAYGACRRSLETTNDVVYAEVPYPGTTHARVLQNLEAALRRHRPAFAFLDQVSSQPAIQMPLPDMVALCRAYGVREIAVDAAHAWGCCCGSPVVPRDVDAWFTNAHKWAFAAPTVCVLWTRLPLRHVVPSWGSGDLATEARWTGTRDYAAFAALPAAVAYLETWRSGQGLNAVEYNRSGLRDALATLRDAWQVPAAYDEDECCSTMAMLPLPKGLDLSRDVPGVPSAGPSLRTRLRSQYRVEAAVGAFRPDDGGFLRLSHAVYVSDDDIARLRDAVLDLLPRRTS